MLAQKRDGLPGLAVIVLHQWSPGIHRPASFYVAIREGLHYQTTLIIHLIQCGLDRLPVNVSLAGQFAVARGTMKMPDMAASLPDRCREIVLFHIHVIWYQVAV